jgi:hypothetical protein
MVVPQKSCCPPIVLKMTKPPSGANEPSSIAEAPQAHESRADAELHAPRRVCRTGIARTRSEKRLQGIGKPGEIDGRGEHREVSNTFELLDVRRAAIVEAAEGLCVGRYGKFFGIACACCVTAVNDRVTAELGVVVCAAAPSVSGLDFRMRPVTLSKVQALLLAALPSVAPPVSPRRDW